jgi:TonB family protein
MRNELENIELIEKYLRDELSAVDKKAFEEQLKTDANLQKEVDLQKETVKGIERLGAKASVQKASRTYDNRRRGFFLGLFLAVIVSGVVGINYISNNTESIEIISEDIVEIVSEDFVEIVGEDTVEIPIDIAKDELEETEVLVAAIEKREFNSEIVSFPKKEFQYFTINSSKDITITGAEGTEITFKANSFNVPKNSVVKIRLKEYYKMSDIAFSNLTTETSDGKLLETGGMVYVDALANNKKVGLKKNTFFDIKFPFDKKKKDMILFDGKTKNKNIVWEESKVEEVNIANDDVRVEAVGEEGENFMLKEWPGQIFTIVENMPEFKGGQKKLFKFLGKNVKYPARAKEMNISGTVYVNFIIDESGKIENAKVLRGIHPLLDREAIRAVESMPNWTPGMQREKVVSVSYNLPIKFKLGDESASYTAEQIKYFSDSLRKAQNTDTEKSLFGTDTLAVKKKPKEQRASMGDISSYALSSSKLGWINCDRFARRGNLNLAIKLDDKNTDVKIIFHRIKSLIAGYNNGLYSKFGRIPTGERVTVFAVKYVDKKPYICLKEFMTSSKSIKLEFDELTKEGLKDVTKRISKI